jgi:hypothetical protein
VKPIIPLHLYCERAKVLILLLAIGLGAALIVPLAQPSYHLPKDPGDVKNVEGPVYQGLSFWSTRSERR